VSFSQVMTALQVPKMLHAGCKAASCRAERLAGERLTSSSPRRHRAGSRSLALGAHARFEARSAVCK
jgi:hypothetical protein